VIKLVVVSECLKDLKFYLNKFLKEKSIYNFNKILFVKLNRMVYAILFYYY